MIIQKELEENNIFGIGPATIIKLHQKGVRKLADLKKAKYFNDLTHAQQLGLEYMDDINERIPRKEMNQINKKFKTVLEGYKWAIVGSYRRNSRRRSCHYRHWCRRSGWTRSRRWVLA